jgi:alanyl-tRNA synthetase
MVNKDDPDVLEIWNNVFITFNREDDGSLKPLPSKHVDTGMGFERLVSAIQDRRSNYDTDVFTPIFDKIQEMTGVRPYEGKLGAEDVDGIDTAYRVVADHARTLTFALSDGGVPDSVGRGYVLRRILRRGARYARKKLNAQIGSFFSQLVPVVVQQLGDVFPELTKKGDELKEILDEEEQSFSRTLDRGEKLFEGYASRAREADATELHGKDVWRLYDTYGFPVDLTLLMAQEIGLGVNDAQFEEAQAQSKEASKARGKAAGKDVVKLDVHDLGVLERDSSVPKTDDSFKYGMWLQVVGLTKINYDQGRETVQAKIKAIYYNKLFVSNTQDIPRDARFGLLLDRTNFYAESGGQEYDTGKIMIGMEAAFEVEDVQVFNGYVLHTGHLKYGEINVGSDVDAEYDEVILGLVRCSLKVTLLCSDTTVANSEQPYCDTHLELCAAGDPWRPH